MRQRAELRLPGRPLLSRFFLGEKKNTFSKRLAFFNVWSVHFRCLFLGRLRPPSPPSSPPNASPFPLSTLISIDFFLSFCDQASSHCALLIKLNSVGHQDDP